MDAAMSSDKRSNARGWAETEGRARLKLALQDWLQLPVADLGVVAGDSACCRRAGLLLRVALR